MTKRSSKKNTDKKVTSAGGASSRSRTRERRAERQRQKRRQQQITLLIAGVAVVVIGVVLFIIVNQPAEAPIPEGVFERYEGIPQTTTDEGFAILGNPDAPVRVDEYSSFSCPACATFHEDSFDRIIELVRDGVISFRYVPLTLGSIPNPEGAARAAICAGEQDAFYEYHDALFEWHLTYGNQAFTQNRINSGIENLGLSVDQFNSCMDSSRPGDVLSAAERVANQNQISSTPTITVNGNALESVATFDEAIQAAFAASGLPAVPLDPGEEPAVEATEEVTEEAEATEEADMTEEAAAPTAEEEAEATAEDEESADEEDVEEPAATEEAGS